MEAEGKGGGKKKKEKKNILQAPGRNQADRAISLSSNHYFC